MATRVNNTISQILKLLREKILKSTTRKKNPVAMSGDGCYLLVVNISQYKQLWNAVHLKQIMLYGACISIKTYTKKTSCGWLKRVPYEKHT